MELDTRETGHSVAALVFLVGFMGCGKNTVGQELARELGWDFLDLDGCIESREKASIPEIFRLQGESAFRLAETDALKDLLERSADHPTVVALGGGAFAQEANRELLRRWPSVFLEAPVEELWRRCSADQLERPLRKDFDQFARLYTERLPAYRQASIIVETQGKDPALICREIEQGLHLGKAAAASRDLLNLR